MKVYYRWHPLHDKELEVVNIQNKGGELFYTIRVPASTIKRLIPSWITDKLYCQKFIQTDAPYCSLDALVELREILNKIIG